MGLLFELPFAKLNEALKSLQSYLLVQVRPTNQSMAVPNC
jgi:hypothetical protein